jgi:putative ABC transport system ATP-binding protein
MSSAVMAAHERAPTTPVVARVERLEKVYRKPGASVAVKALAGVDMDIHQGEMLAIMGASGSGKSTLMNILGCLDRPTSGHYYLDGQDVAELEDDELSEFRGRRLGFIFQNFNLIPQLTVLENLEVPLFYLGVKPALRRERAHELCEMVGLGPRGHHRPVELSGGQQQRVAVARALMNDPIFLLGDEPTGNLDTKTGASIMDLIHQLHERGKTIVIVTHDPNMGDQCSRRVVLRDGLIEHDLRQQKVRPSRPTCGFAG